MPKFKLLRGNHRLGGKRDEHGHVVEPGRNVKRGEVFECEEDLCALFPSNPPKFVRIDEDVELDNEAAVQFNKMTKAQLVKEAENLEVDITGLNSKQAIIERLLAALD